MSCPSTRGGGSGGSYQDIHGHGQLVSGERPHREELGGNETMVRGEGL